MCKKPASVRFGKEYMLTLEDGDMISAVATESSFHSNGWCFEAADLGEYELKDIISFK